MNEHKQYYFKTFICHDMQKTNINGKLLRGSGISKHSSLS